VIINESNAMGYHAAWGISLWTMVAVGAGIHVVRQVDVLFFNYPAVYSRGPQVVHSRIVNRLFLAHHRHSDGLWPEELLCLESILEGVLGLQAL
jgi:hypothetical protein